MSDNRREEIILNGVHGAMFEGCYDGDTCRVFLDEKSQPLRAKDFDTTEMDSKSASERVKAERARRVTREYMLSDPADVSITGERGYYGRLLFLSPELRSLLEDSNLSRKYTPRPSPLPALKK